MKLFLRWCGTVEGQRCPHFTSLYTQPRCIQEHLTQQKEFGRWDHPAQSELKMNTFPGFEYLYKHTSTHTHPLYPVGLLHSKDFNCEFNVWCSGDSVRSEHTWMINTVYSDLQTHTHSCVSIIFGDVTYTYIHFLTVNITTPCLSRVFTLKCNDFHHGDLSFAHLRKANLHNVTV